MSASDVETTPDMSGPSTNPATRNSTAVDRMVRFASADTSTASSRTAAKASNNTEPPRRRVR